MKKTTARKDAGLPYRDARLSPGERVEDLLSRMTVEEKVGQMTQLAGTHPDIVRLVKDCHLGSVLSILGEQTVEVQQVALASRLGIPVLFGIDAIHGHSMEYGATIFPSALALSCSWNEALIGKTARVTALEMMHTGVHWTFSPVFCLPRDLRWGRVNETFGEDPLLIGRFGAAMVQGYQGSDPAAPESIAACAKHFAGYGDTLGGRDASEADHSRRKMRRCFLPPFEAAVKAGVATVMTGYECIDGEPCTSNRWLMTDVLRGEWGFDGVVVTDWDNVGRMVNQKKVSPDIADAAIRAVHAGNDLMMQTPAFYEQAVAAVKDGRIPLAEVDQAVRRILTLKFRLGLFENPRLADGKKAAALIGAKAHRDTAHQAAQEGAVLLKNTGVLPLKKGRIKRIAVIGPNADNDLEQLGDWSLGAGQGQGIMQKHPRHSTVTVLDGLERRFIGAAVDYAEGCTMTGDGAPHKIARAVRLAGQADVAVLVLGDQLPYSGESRSTATLELPGAQKALLDAVAATGTPLVVVFLASKPLAIPEVAATADAILCVFNPGMEGGTAVADILCGEFNPCGKLTIGFPWHVGQQPVLYQQMPGAHQGGYPDLPEGSGFEALFPFGFGLSYTTFALRRPRLKSDTIGLGDSVVAEVQVQNTGERTGTEVVQCYLHDKVTSVTWPIKSLVDFKRVTLKPAEKKTVRFEIPYDALAIIDGACKRVVEPGAFELLIGTSSRDRDLKPLAFTVTGSK
jgi:beta-glucosidase